MKKPAKTPRITVVPANQASWKDLQAVFGSTGQPYRCQCQRFKTPGRQWDSENASVPVAQRAKRLRAQTRCGQPQPETTSGLVAYLDGEPVGWCAIESRTAYVRLGASRRRGERKTKPTAAYGP